MIKDNKLLVKTQVNKAENSTVYIIKNGSKLGQVFNYLPHGIIDKTETGIGGTTCELDAERDSIIVFPFNTLADNKASYKTSKGFDVFFYGSTKYTNTKKTKNKKLSTKPYNPKISLEYYIKQSRKEGKPIKIACILNQVKNLFININSLDNTNSDNFHLVLDEIDTMQEQSTFRNEMVSCINIYKAHPEKKRTMISATLNKFHDEILKKEPLSIFKYEKLTKPALEVVNSKSILEEAVRAILDIKIKDGEKILVACNHIDNCLGIINALKENINTKKKTVAILCSDTRKKKPEHYHQGLLSGGILPKEINFITAAYFNGYDIQEKYHLIILADIKIGSMRLSPKLIYQITGRCRITNGLLTNKLIVSFKNFGNAKFRKYTVNDLVGNSNDLNLIDDIVKQLKTSPSKYYNDIAEEVENILLEGNNYIPSTYEIGPDGNKVPCYIKIDSIMEQQETYSLYNNFSKFIHELGKRFIIQHVPAHYKPGDKKLIDKKDTILAAINLHGKLKLLTFDSDVETEIKQLKDQIDSVSPIESTLLSIYRIALQNQKIDLRKLEFSVYKIIKGKQANARLKELDTYLKYKKFLLVDKIFQEVLERFFPRDTKFFTDQLIKNSETLLKTYKKMAKGKSKEINALILNLKPKNVRGILLSVKHTKIHGNKGYKVLGYDKHDIYQD